jgi:predicted MFS family arabinose efflux permease
VCLSKEQLIAYGSFLLNLLSAANYSGGAWIEAFQTEFAVSLAEASAVSGANNAGFAVGSFVCFLFPQLVNYPSSAFYCVTAHALSFLISSWGVNISTMMVTQGAVLGIASGYCFLYPLTNISRHVPPSKIGKITGWLLAGVAVGLLVWNPLVLALQRSIGWRASARVMGVVSGTLGLIGAELLRRAFEMPTPADATSAKNMNSGPAGTVLAAVEPDEFLTDQTEKQTEAGSTVCTPSPPPAHLPLEQTLPFWLFTAYFGVASVCVYVPW